MRTRRSPRNQERLWRALGDVQPAEKKEEVILTDEQIDKLGGSRARREQFKREAARQRARVAIRKAMDE